VSALRFAGLAMVTALAPIAVLFASPAQADTATPCAQEGAKVWGDTGPIYCQRTATGQLQWVSIPASALCVAFCVNHP
jgi:hypothetical protein